MRKVLNNKGSSILSFVIVIAVVAIMFAAFIPKFSNALMNRAAINKDYINSTDTKVE